MIYLSLMWYLLLTLILVAPPVTLIADEGQPKRNRLSAWLHKRKELRELERKAENVELERRAAFRQQLTARKKINDAIAKRIQKRGHVFVWVTLAAGIITIKYLCDRGGLGCQRKKPEKKKEKTEKTEK